MSSNPPHSFDVMLLMQLAPWQAGAELDSHSSVNKFMQGCAWGSHVEQHSINGRCTRMTPSAPEELPA